MENGCEYVSILHGKCLWSTADSNLEGIFVLNIGRLWLFFSLSHM